MTDVDALLGRADASLEGVTPGPWKTWRYDEAHPLAVTQDIEAENGARVVADMTNEEDPDDPEDAANARFIAESRSLVPELRDALKELTKRNDYLEAGLSLVAESRFPESLIRGSLPGLQATHAIERWSLTAMCDGDLQGLLIVNAPWSDLPPTFLRCPACLAALAPEEKA